MPQLIDLGRIRLQFLGNYSSGTSYSVNSVVRYNNSLYVYINSSASTGNVPTNTTYWSLMLQGFNFENAWSAATEYQINDIVTFGPKTYRALSTQTGNDPSNTTYWEVLTGGVNVTGNWSSATSKYFPGDIVTRGANQYITNTYHTPNATFSVDLNAGKWVVFSSGFRFRGVWAPNTVYLKDDLVTNSLNSYLATLDFTSNGSTFAAETVGNWTLFTPGTDNLPSQLGNEDKLLTTDGTDPIWTDAINLGGSASVAGSFYAGPGAPAYEVSAGLTNAAAVVVFDNGSNDESFAQLAFRNADDTSSTDIIAYSADGDDTYGWVSMGVTGKNFGDPEFTLTAGNTAYIFYEAEQNAAAIGDTGNLVLGTGDKGTTNAIVFAAGGFASGTEQMTIYPDQNVHIEIDTPSTSPSTGAFTVVGGVGVLGDINAQGNIGVQGNQTIVGDLTIQGSINVAGGQFVTENLSSTDPLLFVGSGNEGNVFDLGYMVEAKQPTASARYIFESGVVTASVATITTAAYTVTARAITSNTATLTIGVHSFLAGDTITVSGVNATFNGNYTLTSVTATSVSYAKTNEDITTEASSGTVQFRIDTTTGLIEGDFITLTGAGVFNGTWHLSGVTATTASWESASASYANTNFSPDALATRNSRSKYSGLVKDNADGTWYLFSNLGTRPTTTVDFTDPELVLDTLKMGVLDVATTSTFRGDVVAQKKFNVFATAAARDAAIPAPDAGTMCYRTDIKSQEFYTGTKWEVVENAISPLLTMGLL